LQNYIKDRTIINEGERSDKLYIIREGTCGLFKKNEVKDILGVAKK
jgi:hypothetical protein